MSVNSLFEIIKRDSKFIVSKGGYQLDITFTNVDGSKTANITGWAVKVTGAFDTDGNQVNTKNVHVTFDELSLINKGYPVRTLKRKIPEVDLKDHKFSFKDSSGEVKSYLVTQVLPDENLGLITVFGGDHKPV